MDAERQSNQTGAPIVTDDPMSDLLALAERAEHVLLWDFDMIEGEATKGKGAQADGAVLRCIVDAIALAFDNEGAHTLARFFACVDNVKVRDWAVADEPFLAIEDEATAALLVGRFHAENVRARVFLGDRNCA